MNNQSLFYCGSLMQLIWRYISYTSKWGRAVQYIIRKWLWHWVNHARRVNSSALFRLHDSPINPTCQPKYTLSLLQSSDSWFIDQCWHSRDFKERLSGYILVLYIIHRVYILWIASQCMDKTTFKKLELYLSHCLSIVFSLSACFSEWILKYVWEGVRRSSQLLTAG